MCAQDLNEHCEKTYVGLFDEHKWDIETIFSIWASSENTVKIYFRRGRKLDMSGTQKTLPQPIGSNFAAMKNQKFL